VPVNELTRWLSNPEPTRFPYDAVVAAYHKVGKHFVAEDLLQALARARAALVGAPDPYGSSALLHQFLAIALDKWAGCYDYRTYVGLALLPNPSVDDPPEQLPHALRRRDRLLVQLIADLLEFELAAADGRTDLLPAMRPDAHTVGKRFRLAHKAAAPAVRRLGLAAVANATDPEQAARQLCAAVRPDNSALDRRILQLSLLPVYTVHDEYLFIRVLQLFETTFALMAVQLRGAVHALVLEDCATATTCVQVAQSTLRESAPLFSLLATMQVAAFRTFREFTEGASAIQSRNYKIVESLCRRPDTERLDSTAYLSVPDVHRRVVAGQMTLDEMFSLSCLEGWLTADQRTALAATMERFAEAMIRWRTTHYRLAVRMLGERSGTGYTEGTPYLRSVQTIPVFRRIERASAAHVEGEV
jgi:tryptophan 2,3-dioxygenase